MTKWILGWIYTKPKYVNGIEDSCCCDLKYCLVTITVGVGENLTGSLDPLGEGVGESKNVLILVRSGRFGQRLRRGTLCCRNIQRACPALSRHPEVIPCPVAIPRGHALPFRNIRRVNTRSCRDIQRACPILSQYQKGIYLVLSRYPEDMPCPFAISEGYIPYPVATSKGYTLSCCDIQRESAVVSTTFFVSCHRFMRDSLHGRQNDAEEDLEV